MVDERKVVIEYLRKLAEVDGQCEVIVEAP